MPRLRCTFIRKNNKRCEKRVHSRKELCYWHSKKTRDKASEIMRKASFSRKKYKEESVNVPTSNKVISVREFIKRTVEEEVAKAFNKMMEEN